MKPKYFINDKVWTFYEGVHFSPILVTIEGVSVVNSYWSHRLNKSIIEKSNFYRIKEGCSFYRAEVDLFLSSDEALVVCNDINDRLEREKRIRDRLASLLVNGNELTDGVYDVTNMEYFKVDDREAAIEYIETHRVFWVASAYQTNETILFSKKPHKMSSEWHKEKWVGSGFNYGSTNILKDCPKDVLILAEND